ncbi:MAG: hypothetical protein WDA20_03765 [Desulfuromonadales bacterium]
MDEKKVSDLQDELFKQQNFEVTDLQDEIRVDELCGRLLRFFRQSLIDEDRLTPAEAGALAHGADYFLREFVIPDRRENIFALRPGRVRQFAATWYIIRNLEPNLAELTDILAGIVAFYHYARRIGKVKDDLLHQVEEECRDLAYYSRRIESFWDIQGDGYFAWEQECSLK